MLNTLIYTYYLHCWENGVLHQGDPRNIALARATFSIFWYLVSSPCKALLVKYVGFCPFGVSLIRTALTASEET